MTGKTSARIGLVVAVVVMLVAAYQLGVFQQLSDVARLQRTMIGLGRWGYLAFIVAYALLQPFGVPGTVFIFAAPLIWPWPVAFALSMTGTMAASVIGFSFARFVARDWISKRIPQRFKKYEQRLEEKGFSTVVLLRFIFWMPPLLHAFFGVSRVRFSTHVWGSFVGYLIPLFVVSYFGQKVFDVAKNLPPIAWLAVGAVMLTFLAFVLLPRRRSL
jgi:uncharacterized membrane protein YdjX (TVP38/TMEM64 family)